MFKLPEWKYFKYNMQQKIDEFLASKNRPGRTYSGDSLPQKLGGIFEALKGSPAILISIISVCLLVTVTFAAVTLFSGGGAKVGTYENAWFYDLNTGKLFVSKKTDLPPIDAPSGPLPNGDPAGVMANVMVYENTVDDEGKFIGYLEKLTDDAKIKWKKAIDYNDFSDVKWGQGRFIRRLEDKQWVEANSPEGRQILRSVAKPDEKGQIPRYSYPGK